MISMSYVSWAIFLWFDRGIKASKVPVLLLCVRGYGPGFNWGSGGGVASTFFRRAGRGICAYRGGHFLQPTMSVCVSVCLCVATKMAV